MSFICMRMKNDFHIKGGAPTLVLKQRPGELGNGLLTADSLTLILSVELCSQLLLGWMKRVIQIV